MNIIRTLASGSVATLLAASVHATVIYDNLATATGLYIGGFDYDAVGDEVTLGPGSRLFESVEIAYAGFDFDGDETLTVSLHALNGPLVTDSGGISRNAPGDLLWSSSQSIISTDGDIALFPDSTGGTLVLPDSLAVVVAFDGVDRSAGEDAGPLLYHPPGVGSSDPNFYWLLGFPDPAGSPTGDWFPYGFGFSAGGEAANLGVRINAAAVPDSGSGLAIAGLFLLSTLLFRRMRAQG
jgi:hypothetical protein